MTIRPRQRAYSPPSQPAWRAVSWRTPPHPGRGADRGPPPPRTAADHAAAGLALGAGLLVLILIVLGVRGCLNARKHRALSDYARNVTQIVEETDQTSKPLLRQALGPGQPLGDRVRRRGQRRPQRDGQLRLAGRRPRRPRRHGQRAEHPGAGLRAAQQRDGRNRRQDEHRAGRRRRREGDRRDRQADARAAGQRRPLLRRSPGPRSTACSPTTGSKATTCRRASSSRTGPNGSTKATVSTALGSVSGSTGAGTPGVHGLGLISTSVNGTELTPEATHRGRRGRNARSRSRSPEPGRIDRERRHRLGHGDGGDTAAGNISSIGAGETETVTIPLTPAPKGDVTLEVEAEPVPGEQVTENNEASYTSTSNRRVGDEGRLPRPGRDLHRRRPAARRRREREIEPLRTPTVHDAILAVERGEAERAFVPFENSIEGSVRSTLDTLAFDTEAVTIVGEHDFAVRAHLIAREEVELDADRRRSSPTPSRSPSARASCARTCPGSNGAASAAPPRRCGWSSESERPWAAIGARSAAELYGCTILREGIEDEADNVTRFVWIAPAGTEAGGRRRLEDLARLLRARRGPSRARWSRRCRSSPAARSTCSRIESRPLRRGLGRYMFFCDLEGG